MLKKSLIAVPLLSLAVLGISILPFSIAINESKAAETTPALNGLDEAQLSESKRFALVIGIDNYPGSPLSLPVDDAKLVKQKLESVGFEVTLVVNPTLGQFIEARDEFIKKINSSGDEVTALFFFAGHAVQFNGHNYLIPAESGLLPAPGEMPESPSEAAFIDRAMDAQLGILNYLSGSNASQVIFVLDACRDNPFNPGHRAGARPGGLAKMNAKPGGADTFILFAASPGQPAFDGEPGASNSPFTRAFAQAISQPGSSLATVYSQVNEQVRRITNGDQRPYQEGVLFDFHFIEPLAAPAIASGQNQLLDTGFERSQYDIQNGFILLRQALQKQSIDDIKQAAEGGDAEAQYLLGIAYSKGEGVAADPERTGYWLRRSATRGFSRAQFAYGQRLYWGWGETEPNKTEGFDWWMVASENGNASALLEIGETYLYGREGVPGQDLAKAEEYLTQALSLGAFEAETSLGGLYEVKAEQALQAGDTEAFEEANQKKFTYYQQGAQKGYPYAMYRLARMYRFGDYVEIDLQQAIEWYTKSISADNSNAAFELAQLYADESEAGLGEAQPEEAAKYFRIAMDLGSETAGLELAHLIKTGKIEITSETAQEAIQLYEQAVADGSLRAAAQLSDLYFKGELTDKNLKKAEQYGLKALELEKTVEPDSEDAWPMYVQTAYSNLLKLYKQEELIPTNSQLVKTLEDRVGSLDGGMKRFTVPMTCGTFKSPFHVYVWDWKLDQPPTTAQFAWVEQARGCKVADDVVEAFEKLYTIARENNVSYTDLTVYALSNANKNNSNESNNE
jgi:TPR repeat protein